jgi:hypothetical protein
MHNLIYLLEVETRLAPVRNRGSYEVQHSSRVGGLDWFSQHSGSISPLRDEPLFAGSRIGSTTLVLVPVGVAIPGFRANERWQEPDLYGRLMRKITYSRQRRSGFNPVKLLRH